MDLKFSKDLAVTMSKRSSGEVARALYREQGKKFCVGLVLHLIMYISGSYSEEEDE